jgi:hypothetical protein
MRWAVLALSFSSLSLSPLASSVELSSDGCVPFAPVCCVRPRSGVVLPWRDWIVKPLASLALHGDLPPMFCA